MEHQKKKISEVEKKETGRTFPNEKYMHKILLMHSDFINSEYTR